ncbi:cellulose synthase subunit [Clostridium cavendishii DSM 21758]|uniref:Cellulose synthase subunit n=1 Tax=Clostridium cavendishii DSM 21758 TaxID=1121302 RepID=A0A1M6GAV5_9CLOT|nr:cellulose biosynthesis cyclic di-GMP-binding regulatory protein BcsB [Clostridium cavendishii]SHJ07080.1 cellulose synthase subunit [Clostridium cavendishii DSM 21758]
MKRIFSISMIFILCINLLTIKVMAAPASLEKIYKYPKDTVLQGVFPSYSFGFNVDNHWILKDDNYVYLSFDVSEVEEYLNSSITVSLNNTPLKSLNISNIKGNKTIKISLPKDSILKGYNSIRVTAFHKITKEKCEFDDVNVANWITLRKESNVHISYDYEEPNYKISSFPYPYLKINTENLSDFIIVVNNKLTEVELSSILKLSSLLGREANRENMNFKIVKESDLSDEDKNNNIIYLGKYENAPSFVKSAVLEGEEKQITDNALVVNIKSPLNANKSLYIITSKNDLLLSEALYYIENKDAREQLNIGRVILGKYSGEKSIKTDTSNMSFEKLGFDNIKLIGSFYNSANYGVVIPKDRAINGKAYIDLKYRTSRVIDFSKSTITIFINGEFVKDAHIEEIADDSERELKVYIPGKYKPGDYLNIEVAFYLAPKDFQCYEQGRENSWVYVDKESYIDFGKATNDKILLNYYGYPFIKDGEFNNLKIVLPSKINSNIITVAGNICSYLGRDTKSTGDLYAIYDQNFKEDKANYIVLGAPNTNNLIKKYNNNLNIPYEDNFNTFKSTQKLPIVNNFKNYDATLNLIKAPWNRDGSILFFTSPKEELIYKNMKFLVEDNFVKKVKGDGTIIDTEGSVFNAYFKVKEESVKDNEGSLIERIGKERLYIIVIASIFIITILGVGAWTLFKDKRNIK